jgi:hypothetical protein
LRNTANIGDAKIGATLILHTARLAHREAFIGNADRFRHLPAVFI